MVLTILIISLIVSIISIIISSISIIISIVSIIVGIISIQGQHLRVAEPKTSGSSGGQRNLRYGRAKGT